MAKEVNKSNKDKKSKNDKKDSKGFFKEFKAELKRVSWPTFKQLVNSTIAVLTIVIVLAVFVFVLDIIFENMNKFGVEGLKAIVTSSSDETTEEGEDTSNEAEVVDATDSETVDETGDAEETTIEEVDTEDSTEVQAGDETAVTEEVQTEVPAETTEATTDETVNQ